MKKITFKRVFRMSFFVGQEKVFGLSYNSMRTKLLSHQYATHIASASDMYFISM